MCGGLGLRCKWRSFSGRSLRSVKGVLLDAASIPLEANGQTSWLIDQAFPAADTSDFTGSVRCDAVGEGLFSTVALEMDPGNRIFITLPVVPVED